MDADGLGLVLAVISLHAYEVGVCGLIEACPECQHVLIGLVNSFYELNMKQQVKGWRLRMMIKCEQFVYLSLPHYIW